MHTDRLQTAGKPHKGKGMPSMSVWHTTPPIPAKIIAALVGLWLLSHAKSIRAELSLRPAWVESCEQVHCTILVHSQ